MTNEMLSQHSGYQKLHGFLSNFFLFRQGLEGNELHEFDKKYLSELHAQLLHFEIVHGFDSLTTLPDRDKS
jgi:hypothetical protein